MMPSVALSQRRCRCGPGQEAEQTGLTECRGRSQDTDRSNKTQPLQFAALHSGPDQTQGQKSQWIQLEEQLKADSSGALVADNLTLLKSHMCIRPCGVFKAGAVARDQSALFLWQKLEATAACWPFKGQRNKTRSDCELWCSRDQLGCCRSS